MAFRFLKGIRKYSRVEASGVRARIRAASPPLRSTKDSRRSRAAVLKALGVTCEGWCIEKYSKSSGDGSVRFTRKLLGRRIVSLRNRGDKIRAANLTFEPLLGPLLALDQLRAHDRDALEDFASSDAHARAEHGAAHSRARLHVRAFPEHALLDGRALFDERGLVPHHVAAFQLHERDVRVEVSPDGREFVPVAARDVRGHALALLNRSEERRVGKECRSRWSPYH